MCVCLLPRPAQARPAERTTNIYRAFSQFTARVGRISLLDGNYVSRRASYVMQRLSFSTETVLSNQRRSRKTIQTAAFADLRFCDYVPVAVVHAVPMLRARARALTHTNANVYTDHGHARLCQPAAAPRTWSGGCGTGRGVGGRICHVLLLRRVWWVRGERTDDNLIDIIYAICQYV